MIIKKKNLNKNNWMDFKGLFRIYFNIKSINKGKLNHRRKNLN